MEAEVTYLSVGMWSSRSHNGLRLLILPASFVFLADRTTPSRSASGRAAVLKQLGAKSPFNSSYYVEGGCVCAFEVQLDSICGLDYSNPLCQPGRLVLEVHHVRKREFKTMESARAYYLSDTLRFGSGFGSGSAAEALGLCCTPPGSASGAQPAAAATPPAAGPFSGTSGATPRSSQPSAPAASATGATAAVVGEPAAGPAPGHPPGGRRLRRRASAAKHSLLSRLEGSMASLDSLSDSSSARSCGSLQFRGSLDASSVEGACETAAAATAAAAAGARPAALQQAADDSRSGGALTAGLPVPVRDSSASGAVGPGSSRQGGTCQANGLRVEIPPAAAAGGGGGLWDGPASPDQPFHVGSAPSLSGFLALPPGAPMASAAPCSTTAVARAATAAAPAPAPGSANGPPLRHAKSTGDLLAAASSAQRAQHAQQGAGALGSASLAASPAQSWPSPYVWTSTSSVYKYRTIIFQFAEPGLPQLLQPVIQGNERLLKMYESGLPAWAIFMPAYGLYYRPWLRGLTWLLYYAFSIFSLACGFYDLWRHFPGVQLLLQRVMSGLWLPPASILQWLEEHAQFRLSILLTYLFGKSEAFVQLVRWAGNIVRGLRVAVQPAVDALGPPLAALSQAAALLGAQAWHTAGGVWLAVGSLLYSLLAPFVQLAAEVWGSLSAALAPAMLLVYSVIVGPLSWAFSAWRHLRAASGVLWVGLVEAGRGVAAGAHAVKATVSAGKAVHRSSPDVASVSWLYLIPAETLEVLHNSAVKVMRALQTVAKFVVQMGSDVVRHRISLTLRAQRALQRGRRRLHAWLALPGRALVAVAARLMRLVQMLLWLAVSDAAGQPQGMAEDAAAGGGGGEGGGGDALASGSSKLLDPAVALVASAAAAGGGEGGAELRHRHLAAVAAAAAAGEGEAGEATYDARWEDREGSEEGGAAEPLPPLQSRLKAE